MFIRVIRGLQSESIDALFDRKAEHLAAAPVRALAMLARRRNQPIDQLKQNLGWQQAEHGT